MADQHSLYWIILSINFAIFALYQVYAISVMIRLKLKMDKAALVMILLFFSCSLFRTAVLVYSIVTAPNCISCLVHDSLSVIDYNIMILITCALYNFVYEVRIVYINFNHSNYVNIDKVLKSNYKIKVFHICFVVFLSLTNTLLYALSY